MPEDTTYREKELLFLIAENDEGAFQEIFRMFHNKLATYVLRLTGSFPVTQEIVQDVFLKVWQHRDTLTTIKNFDAYLFTIAHNHTINCITRIAREERRYREWKSQVVLSPQADADGADETELRHRKLEEAILLLPPQQQKIYLLHRKEGLPHAAIAERMGLALDTVKKQMSRAMKNIRIFILKNNNQFFGWAVPLFLFPVVF